MLPMLQKHSRSPGFLCHCLVARQQTGSDVNTMIDLLSNDFRGVWRGKIRRGSSTFDLSWNALPSCFVIRTMFDRFGLLLAVLSR